MKRYSGCLIIFLLGIASNLNAQSGVQISPVPIPTNPAAILQVQSANQGVLLPRTTIGSIANPTDGLIVYDTVVNHYMYYNENQWTALLTAPAFSFYYADRDGDTYGDKYAAIYATTIPMGYVSNATDCNDDNPSIHPGGDELCDNLDNDCDGQIDEGFNLGASCMVGVGACQMSGVLICDGNGGVVCSATPGTPGTEICGNGIDDNCDGQVDEGTTEICNGVDDDCDGDIDEGFNLGSACNVLFGDCEVPGVTVCDGIGGVICFANPDADQDGFNYCDDCDDNNPNIYPNAPELCNEIDDDCDGDVDENCFTIDWCNLQFPFTMSIEGGMQSDPVYGQVYVDGVTNTPGQGAGLLSQVGFGPDGSDPASGSWTWVTAVYNTDAGPSNNNDEYVGSFVVPFTIGSYDYAYRFSGDNGATWTYGDSDGSTNGYQSANAGNLMVN